MIKIHGEIHSSKNSRQIHTNRRTGKMFVAKSTAAKDDEQNLARQLEDSANCDLWIFMTRGRHYPYRVKFHFIRKTKARWDFANLVQGVADAMVKAGYLEDDDVYHFIPIYDGYEVDKENAGVEIRIE